MIAGLLLGFVFSQRPGKREHAAGAEHPIRSRILQIIKEHLGINEACITKRIGMKRGAVRHHLKFMVEARVLDRFSVGRENHYFPPGIEADKKDAYALAHHGRANLVLREILLDPGIPQFELAKRVQMTRKILRGHLDFLTRNGLVEEQRQDRFQTYFPGARLDWFIRDEILAPECPTPGPAPAFGETTRDVVRGPHP